MPQDLPPQNVYDEEDFFRGYATLERSRADWGDAFEHGSFDSLLPDPTDMRVLDLGCGAGQLTVHIAGLGAAEVVGMDVSERMLEQARSGRAHPNVTYRRAAMEDVEFEAGRFELVVSSLAFHYVDDYAGLLRRIGKWLSPRGHLVFSTEHPIFTSRIAADAWMRDASGQPKHWMIDRYGREGVREDHWFRDGVRRFHRTVATLVNGVIDSGLILERLLEPVPDSTTLALHPDWAEELIRPTFVLVRARKA